MLWRTDEGVCPYRLALSLIKGTPFAIREGRFLDTRRAFLRCKETPSSKRRERFFNFKILLPLFLSGIGIRVNDSIYSSYLFSERGGGGFSSEEKDSTYHAPRTSLGASHPLEGLSEAPFE